MADMYNKCNKCFANAKRPCNCCVLCLHLKSSLCSCSEGRGIANQPPLVSED